jgi:hypothetical protein
MASHSRNFYLRKKLFKLISSNNKLELDLCRIMKIYQDLEKKSTKRKNIAHNYLKVF